MARPEFIKCQECGRILSSPECVHCLTREERVNQTLRDIYQPKGKPNKNMKKRD